MHRQLNERRQITLPPKLLEKIGAKSGQYFDIQAEGRRLVLIPTTVQEMDDESYDWKALDRLVKQEKKKAKGFKTGREAKSYLKKIISQ